jgi:hypothetical protein
MEMMKIATEKMIKIAAKPARPGDNVSKMKTMKSGAEIADTHLPTQNLVLGSGYHRSACGGSSPSSVIFSEIILLFIILALCRTSIIRVFCSFLHY